MVLVDSSVWIDFFADAPQTDRLEELLEKKEVSCHSLIYLELMLGDLGPRRKQVLCDIDLLPKSVDCSIQEIRNFVEEEKLFGTGLSLVDAHLLYACLVEDQLLWTHDRILHRAAVHYKKAFRF